MRRLNPDQLNFLRQGNKAPQQQQKPSDMANTTPNQRVTKRSQFNESKSGITAALSEQQSSKINSSLQGTPTESPAKLKKPTGRTIKNFGVKLTRNMMGTTRLQEWQKFGKVSGAAPTSEREVKPFKGDSFLASQLKQKVEMEARQPRKSQIRIRRVVSERQVQVEDKLECVGELIRAIRRQWRPAGVYCKWLDRQIVIEMLEKVSQRYSRSSRQLVKQLLTFMKRVKEAATINLENTTPHEIIQDNTRKLTTIAKLYLAVKKQSFSVDKQPDEQQIQQNCKQLSKILESIKIMKSRLETNQSELALSYNNITILSCLKRYDQVRAQLLKISQTNQQKKDPSSHSTIFEAVDSLIVYLHSSKDQQSLAVDLLDRLAIASCKQNHYQQSITFYQKSLELKQKIKGKMSLGCASTLIKIANLYYSNKQYQEALTHYNLCLSIQKHIKGKDSIDCAYTLNNVGLALTQLKQFKQAVSSYKQSLQIKINKLGQNSLEVSQSLCNLGVVLKKDKQYEDAMDCFQRALNIVRSVKEAQWKDRASILHNIGSVYSAKRQYGQALNYYNRSLQEKDREKQPLSYQLTLLNIERVKKEQSEELL